MARVQTFNRTSLKASLATSPSSTSPALESYLHICERVQRRNHRTLMDALYSHHADFGCPENTPWDPATETGEPTNSQIEIIPANVPGEGILTYNHDAAGGCHPELARFSTTNLGGYFPAFQNPPEAWIIGNFNGASKQKEILLLPYDDTYNAGLNVLGMTDGQRHYDSISSALIPAPEACNSTRVAEEQYQHSSTSFFHPPAPDVDLVVDVPSLSPSPATIPYTTLLPDQHSKYSELSANLAYMAALSVPPDAGSPKEKRTTGIERRKKEKMTTKVKEKHYKRFFEVPEASAGALLSTLDWSGIKPAAGNALTQGREEDFETLQIPMSTNVAAGAKLGKTNKSLPPKHIPPPRSVCREGSSNFGTSPSGKKLGLACLFCRERKIACGRPSGSNQDQTCNQCARRHFKCEYPTESRRGQHKRSKANAEPSKS